MELTEKERKEISWRIAKVKESGHGAVIILVKNKAIWRYKMELDDLAEENK